MDIDAFSEKGSGLDMDIFRAMCAEYEDLFPYLRSPVPTSTLTAGAEYEDLFPYLELKSLEAKATA